jgi:hypothetical protein
MPTFDGHSTHAAEARQALRQLAHATRHLDDATEIYPILGELTAGLDSLAQSLHQIGAFHEGPAFERTWASGNLRAWRAASYEVAWELHRAAEMVHQVATGLDRAHETEATIDYSPRKGPALRSVPRPTHEPALAL